MQTLIAGSPVTLHGGADNPSVTDSIGQRSTARMTLRDDSGTARYQQGSGVAIFDDTGALIFAGTVESDVMSKPTFGNILLHEIGCSDWHRLADKRIIATSYSGQTCGFMINDIIANWLAAEGVFAVKNVLSANQSDVETNTTGFTSISSATLTRDTTASWHGVASLKTVTPGSVANEGVAVRVASTTLQAGAQYTASVYLRGSGTVILAGNGDALGNIGSPLNITLSGVWTRYSVTFTLPATISGNIGFTVRTSGTAALTWNMDGMQLEPNWAGVPASTWELGGTSSVQAGPTLAGTLVFNYKTATHAIDKIATLSGFYWYIDPYKRFWFAAYSTNAAPFTFDGTQADNDSLTLELANPLYRNGQWVVGHKEVTAAQTETRKGDGATRAFVFSFPLHQAPSSVTVNGVAKTVGKLGFDTGKDFYYAQGSDVLTQDNAGTLLISTDTLSMTYVGEFNSVAYSQDSAQVAMQAALEGGGSSGIVEDILVDKALVTVNQAFQSAAALLAKYATSGQIIKFVTKTPGLASGQLLSATLPAPWSINGQFLIETVQIRYDGIARWWYDVTALSGPVNDTWVQFFTRLAPQQTVTDDESVGASQIVNLLQSINETWTWTENVAPVVTTCPVFPITFPKVFC